MIERNTQMTERNSQMHHTRRHRAKALGLRTIPPKDRPGAGPLPARLQKRGEGGPTRTQAPRKWRTLICLLVLLAWTVFATKTKALASAISPEAQTTSVTLAKPDTATRARLTEAYGELPLSFEANHGQSDPRVKFLSHTKGYTLFLTATEAVLSLDKGQGQGPVQVGRLPLRTRTAKPL
jgi:hypothetical protein